MKQRQRIGQQTTTEMMTTAAGCLCHLWSTLRRLDCFLSALLLLFYYYSYCILLRRISLHYTINLHLRARSSYFPYFYLYYYYHFLIYLLLVKVRFYRRNHRQHAHTQTHARAYIQTQAHAQTRIDGPRMQAQLRILRCPLFFYIILLHSTKITEHKIK